MPPLHNSARVTEPGPSFSSPPTAVHQDFVTHAMAGSPMSCAAGIRGVGWMLQVVPFQRSARSMPPALVNVNPIAVQAEAPRQDTPFSWPPPGGFGVGSIVHAEPFHRSARVPWSEPPTARQADGAVQFTPEKIADWVPDGFGVGWTVQAVPFQRSAAVRAIPEAECCSPTAVQADGEVHEIPPRKVWTEPTGLGVVRMVHLVPFHRSVRGRTGLDCDAVVKYAPAAMQSEADVHEMPSRPLPWAPAGLGMGWMVHRVPFHRSARVPDGDIPTAMHAEGDVQDTALREAPATVGMGCVLHLVPFHRSASALFAPVPTPMHADGLVHATPDSWLSAAPAGLGVRWTRQLLPFHRCAIASGVPEPCENPSAVHASRAGQDTAARKSPWAPPGLGVRWIVHLVPFHRSATGRKSPDFLMYAPTAVHADGDEQPTPFRKMNWLPAGLGVD